MYRLKSNGHQSIAAEILLSLAVLLRLRACVCLVWIYMYVCAQIDDELITLSHIRQYIWEKKGWLQHTRMLISSLMTKCQEKDLLCSAWQIKSSRSNFSSMCTHRPSSDVRKELQREHWIFYVILHTNMVEVLLFVHSIWPGIIKLRITSNALWCIWFNGSFLFSFVQ